MPLKSTQKADVHDRRAEDLSNAVIPLKTRLEFSRVITRLWGEANEKFLAIGRYLIMAKQVLPHGEYQPMISQDLPFKPGTARMIVTATQAIDGGLLPRDRLPPSYSTVYLLTTLSDEERDAADKNGLIRPDVRRQEIVFFKRTLAASRVSEHDRLRAERDKLRTEQARIESRLAELEAMIGGDVIDVEAVEL